MSFLKKLGKAVKRVFSGVGKAFRKVAKSKFGKLLLAAAAIYVGGALLGAWARPAWLGGGAASEGLVTAATPGTGGVAPALPSEVVSTAAQTAGAAAEAGAAGGAAASEGLVTAATNAAQAPSMVGSAAAVTPQQAATFQSLSSTGMDSVTAAKMSGMSETVVQSLAPKGLIGKAGAFLSKNPLLGYGGMMIGGQMIAGAMQPDATEEQLKLERERRLASNYSGVYGDGRTEQINLPHAGLITQAGMTPYNPRG